MMYNYNNKNGKYKNSCMRIIEKIINNSLRTKFTIMLIYVICLFVADLLVLQNIKNISKN